MTLVTIDWIIPGAIVQKSESWSGSNIRPLSVNWLKNLIYIKELLSTYPLRLSPQTAQKDDMQSQMIVIKIL